MLDDLFERESPTESVNVGVNFKELSFSGSGRQKGFHHAFHRDFHHSSSTLIEHLRKNIIHS